MSLATINLIDEHAALRHNPCHRRNMVRDLTKSVRRFLIEDFQQRSEKVTEEIREFFELETGDTYLQGAYTVLKRWYHHVSARAPNSSRVNIPKVSKNYATIYHREDPHPPGRPLDTHIYTFQINNESP